jgi:hypothetical protein
MQCSAAPKHGFFVQSSKTCQKDSIKDHQGIYERIKDYPILSRVKNSEKKEALSLGQQRNPSENHPTQKESSQVAR